MSALTSPPHVATAARRDRRLSGARGRYGRSTGRSGGGWRLPAAGRGGSPGARCGPPGRVAYGPVVPVARAQAAAEPDPVHARPGPAWAAPGPRACHRLRVLVAMGPVRCLQPFPAGPAVAARLGTVLPAF